MTGATGTLPRAVNLIDAKKRKVAGLDSLRFVCAAIVVLDHLALVDLGRAGKTATGLTKILIGLNNCLFNGPAAVIIFFIISGFCIHFPFKGNRTPVLPEYFSRRLLRIGPPALVFVLYLRFVLDQHVRLQDTVLWSVLCEIVYYLLYPLLLAIHRRVGWLRMIIVTYAFSFALAGCNLSTLKAENNSYTALGLSGTWIIGLPCWLMGCWLAEHFHRFPLLSQQQIWALRFAVFTVTVGTRLIKFHVTSPFASNCFTLNLFALLALFWIGSEIVYLSHHSASKVLEWSGQWSYSIYLVHTLVPLTITLLGFKWLTSRNWLAHLGLIALAFLASYGFSLVIEQPSHRLAVKVGRMLQQRVLARG